MTDIKEQILYEDRQILVCRKPSGLAVQNARPGVPDMESLLKNYLAAGSENRFRSRANRQEKPSASKNREYGRKPEMPWLAAVHRLDQPVEGVLVFAKTPQAAKELSRQIAAGETEKIYLAVTCGEVPAKKGILEDFLKKDGRANTSFVAAEGTPGSKRAVLSYEMLESCGEDKTRKLLRIRLQTGRHHQIRVQMAHAGMPLLGDRKYGPPDTAAYPLALCAASLTFRHPTSKQTMHFCTAPEGKGFAGFQTLSQ